jgi:hypothetical protein
VKRKILFTLPFFDRMKNSFSSYLFLLLLSIIHLYSNAQDVSDITHRKIKTIADIPHKTLHEKWMWPHRSFAFIATKERKINYDTTYIRSYYKRLVVTLPVSTRFLRFTLMDQKTGNKLIFNPNLQYNLGIGISSRWSSFVFNSGLKIFTGNDGLRGKTTQRDYQLHLYGRKFSSDIFVQHYKGFYIKNSESYDAYTSEQSYAIREDINALNIGASTLYIVNNKRYSYGNSFAFVEQQRKSTGSLLFGLYYAYFSAHGDESLVSSPFNASFDSLSLIKSGHSHNFGLSAGYIYTFVFLKKCYATTGFTQGFGIERSSYTRNDNTSYQQVSAGAGKLNLRLALRYDNGRSFIGTMGMFDYYLFRGKANSTFDHSYGKLMIYAGYRFSVIKEEKKLLKKLKLIDY